MILVGHSMPILSSTKTSSQSIHSKASLGFMMSSVTHALTLGQLLIQEVFCMADFQGRPHANIPYLNIRLARLVGKADRPK
jgi:hypothetical protein